jgi:hypothetical protein
MKKEGHLVSDTSDLLNKNHQSKLAIEGKVVKNSVSGCGCGGKKKKNSKIVSFKNNKSKQSTVIEKQSVLEKQVHPVIFEPQVQDVEWSLNENYDITTEGKQHPKFKQTELNQPILEEQKVESTFQKIKRLWKFL